MRLIAIYPFEKQKYVSQFFDLNGEALFRKLRLHICLAWWWISLLLLRCAPSICEYECVWVYVCVCANHRANHLLMRSNCLCNASLFIIFSPRKTYSRVYLLHCIPQILCSCKTNSLKHNVCRPGKNGALIGLLRKNSGHAGCLYVCRGNIAKCFKQSLSVECRLLNLLVIPERTGFILLFTFGQRISVLRINQRCLQ